MTEPLHISRRRWRRLIRELAVRGRGQRESGAFLLARPSDPKQTIREAVFFDDLDAEALTGIISFRGSAYGPLWRTCERLGMRVVADIHTHPGATVRQSATDAGNPMIAQTGHFALIAPNFAQGRITPSSVGVHEYLGGHRWSSFYGADAAALIKRTWW